MDNKDKNEEKKDDEIKDLEDQLEQLLKEVSKDQNMPQMSVRIDSTGGKTLNRVFCKNSILDSITKIVFSFLMVFTINQFIPFFKGDILWFTVFTLSAIVIDFAINAIFSKRLFLYNLVTGGLINTVITILSFLGVGFILKQFLDIKFLSTGIIILDFLIFIIIRKFVYKYFKLKLLKL